MQEGIDMFKEHMEEEKWSLVKQHKHGNVVKKHKYEEIRSSSTSMEEMVSKGKSKKRYC